MPKGFVTRKGDLKGKSHYAAQQSHLHNLVPMLWLCHADERQVSDLPEGLLKIWRSMTAGRRPEKEAGAPGKSETCRSSAWQSHNSATGCLQATRLNVIVRYYFVVWVAPERFLFSALSCNRVPNQLCFASDDGGLAGYRVSNPGVQTVRLSQDPALGSA